MPGPTAMTVTPQLSTSTDNSLIATKDTGSLMGHRFLQHLRVGIIGAPLSEGQGLTGVARGPEQIRESGLEEILRQAGRPMEDCGNVKFEELDPAEKVENMHPGIKNCTEVGRKAEIIFRTVAEHAAQKKMVVNLGGDHGIASATIGAMLSVYPDLVVIWVDAHADCNTPTSSPSGNYHGMPLAHALGWFGHAKGETLPGFDWHSKIPKLEEERTALIGLRDVDEAEKALLRSSRVNLYPMRSVDELGIAAVIKDAMNRVDPSNTRPIHLSFDIDGCDPMIAPATGTCSRGGLSSREAHFICETLHSTGRLVSMDLVEVNSELESVEQPMHGDRIQVAAHPTARLAVELIGSACGTSTL